MTTQVELTWNETTGRYENEDIWVDGDVYAEARADRARTLYADGVPEMEAFEQADQEMADPLGWMEMAHDAGDDGAGLMTEQQTDQTMSKRQALDDAMDRLLQTVAQRGADHITRHPQDTGEDLNAHIAHILVAARQEAIALVLAHLAKS